MKGIPYKSPERPEFIPETTAPIKLPRRDNNIEVWKPLYQTNGKERIQTNPVHMSLEAGKEWLADVYNFGFVALHVISKENVLTLCSPSGHVLIFTQTGPELQLPLEVRDILYKIKDVKKVAIYNEVIEKFLTSNGMDPLTLVDLHPLAKKNIAEISFGIHNFFKQQLGKDFVPGGTFDIDSDVHVYQVAHLSRAVAYAVWFIVAKLATRAGLDSSGNISSFLRYTLFLEDADKYANLIADPYYVPFEEVTLSPLHQENLERESARLEVALRKAYKNYRFRPKVPFGFDTSPSPCCQACGIFVNPTRPSTHTCSIKMGCYYPYCTTSGLPHTPITCKWIQAWCNLCQHRGHEAELHYRYDPKFPTCYFWDIFKKFSRINLDTGYVFKKDKCQNPFFHQMGLYGLPPSKLPKTAPESGVGLDLPDDPRYKRPDSTQLPTRRPSMPVKIDLRTLNKTQPGRVEKPKSITISGLTEALKLVKNLSSGNKAGSSGKQNEIQDPVVSKLLDFVKDITQGGSRPSAVATSSVALAPGKPNRKERRQANRAKRAALEQSSASVDFDSAALGTVPPLAYSEGRQWTDSEAERLLALTAEEIAAGHDTPVNTSQDHSDLMEMGVEPIHPRQVESLADLVQRVVVQDQPDQESEQRPSDLS